MKYAFLLQQGVIFSVLWSKAKVCFFIFTTTGKYFLVSFVEQQNFLFNDKILTTIF